MSPVQLYAQSTLRYMEQDLETFEAVFTSSFRGKLGVAMITNATAALDLFAWLLYHEPNSNNKVLFKKIVSDRRFFAEGIFINADVLYGVIRCGVVHQFYPKSIGIIADGRDDVFLKKEGRIYVNALAFYRAVIKGLRKIRDHISILSGDELADLDAKYLLRQKNDDKSYEKSELDAADIPEI